MNFLDHQLQAAMLKVVNAATKAKAEDVTDKYTELKKKSQARCVIRGEETFSHLRVLALPSLDFLFLAFLPSSLPSPRHSYYRSCGRMGIFILLT